MTKIITRRTPEQIVADLQAKIAAVQARAAAKEARSKPESAAFIAAARALQKALAAAKTEKNAAMEGVLEAALATLGVHAGEAGSACRSRARRSPAAVGRSPPPRRLGASVPCHSSGYQVHP